MQIQELAKSIVEELVSSGAIEDAIRKATNITPAPHPTASNNGNYSDEQKLRFGLRGDVMNLTDKLCAKYGYEKIAVFGALKKLTGTSQSEATPAELSKRVDILQGWLEHGMQ